MTATKRSAPLKPFRHTGNSFNLHSYSNGDYRMEALSYGREWQLTLYRYGKDFRELGEIATRRFRPRSHTYQLPDATVTRLAREMTRRARGYQ